MAVSINRGSLLRVSLQPELCYFGSTLRPPDFWKLPCSKNGIDVMYAVWYIYMAYDAWCSIQR